MASASTTALDPDILLSAFSECRASTGDVPLAALAAGMDQLRRIVLTLGSAFGIASSDITEKVETLNARIQDIKTCGRTLQPPIAGAKVAPAYDPTTARATVQCASLACCRAPPERAAGGPHHRVPLPVPSLLPPPPADLVQWEIERKVTEMHDKKYTSGARSILRLMWFMDFLQVREGGRAGGRAGGPRRTA